MDLHERQQFDFLLQVAVERFVERMEHTGATMDKLGTFTDAIFSDFLLDNADGACFILCAMPGKNAAALIAMAKTAFTELLRRKVEESLDQRSAY